MKICSRLWLAMSKIGRFSRITCSNWKGFLLFTRSISSEKVMASGKMS